LPEPSRLRHSKANGSQGHATAWHGNLRSGRGSRTVGTWSALKLFALTPTCNAAPRLPPGARGGWSRRALTRFQDNAAAPAASFPMPQPQAKPLTRGVPPSDAAFVPLAIVDASGGGLLEIEFGNACTVRLKGTVDPKLLRVAIRAAGRLGGTTQGGD
jgi:hypothetical protein